MESLCFLPSKLFDVTKSVINFHSWALYAFNIIFGALHNLVARYLRKVKAGILAMIFYKEATIRAESVGTVQG